MNLTIRALTHSWIYNHCMFLKQTHCMYLCFTFHDEILGDYNYHNHLSINAIKQFFQRLTVAPPVKNRSHISSKLSFHYGLQKSQTLNSVQYVSHTLQLRSILYEVSLAV
jgi:hypothetical protein